MYGNHSGPRLCSYVSREEALQKKLIYTLEDGTVIMKGDNDTWLGHGVKRDRYAILWLE